MSAGDRAAVARIRRTPVLRALAAQGMTGTMQAALIAVTHTSPGPVVDNALTWNHPSMTWEHARYLLAEPDHAPAGDEWRADRDRARAALMAD